MTENLQLCNDQASCPLCVTIISNSWLFLDSKAYQFLLIYRWDTMAACINQTALQNIPFISTAKGQSCRLVGPWNNIFSLDTLRQDPDLILEAPSKDPEDKFHLRPCGKSPLCNGSICFEHKNRKFSLGYISTYQLKLAEKEVRVRYSSQEHCLHGLNYSAQVRYTCHMEQLEPKIELIGQLACHYIFRWTTNRICPFFNPLIFGHTPYSPPWHWLLGLSALTLTTAAFYIYYRKSPNRVRDLFRFLKQKVGWDRGRPDEDRHLLVRDVHLPTLGGLQALEDDDELILA